MSRTYRRENYKPYWVGTTWTSTCRIPLEGDELKRELAKWHGDHCYRMSPSKWFRQNEHQTFRAKARQEIVRWYKNEDHEVQISDQSRWPYWD